MERGTEFTGNEQDIAALTASMGFMIAEFAVKQVRKTLHVHLVLYKKEGVSLNDCAAVHRAVMPRMEVLYDNRSIHLEVSSPGIDRKIKTIRELKLYPGKGISVLGVDGEWTGGILKSVDGVIRIDTGSEERVLEYDAVLKAKLDFAREVVR